MWATSRTSCEQVDTPGGRKPSILSLTAPTLRVWTQPPLMEAPGPAVKGGPAWGLPFISGGSYGHTTMPSLREFDTSLRRAAPTSSHICSEHTLRRRLPAGMTLRVAA